jgi:cytochrome c oxidase subunit IV
MSERLTSPLGYIIVFVILSVLTVVTVGVSFMPLTGLWHVILGETIAVGKASLVVLFFMHALHSPQQTRAVIAVTVFWFVVVLMALIFSDYLSRGLIPYLPGH